MAYALAVRQRTDTSVPSYLLALSISVVALGALLHLYLLYVRGVPSTEAPAKSVELKEDPRSAAMRPTPPWKAVPSISSIKGFYTDSSGFRKLHIRHRSESAVLAEKWGSPRTWKLTILYPGDRFNRECSFYGKSWAEGWFTARCRGTNLENTGPWHTVALHLEQRSDRPGMLRVRIGSELNNKWILKASEK